MHTSAIRLSVWPWSVPDSGPPYPNPLATTAFRSPNRWCSVLHRGEIPFGRILGTTRKYTFSWTRCMTSVLMHKTELIVPPHALLPPTPSGTVHHYSPCLLPTVHAHSMIADACTLMELTTSDKSMRLRSQAMLPHAFDRRQHSAKWKEKRFRTGGANLWTRGEWPSD